MNRKRIQAVFLLVILSAFLCFSSCRKKKNTEADRHQNDISEVIGTESVVNTYTAAASLTEKYALYHSNSGQLRIFDANSKTDIAFCFNPGCEHEREKRTITGELLKEGCPSYNYSSWAVFLDGDSCVFLRDNGEVIRSDRQGENRRVIATIPSYLSIGTNEVFYADNSMFVYTAMHYEIIEMKDSDGTSQWTIGDTKDTQDCRLIRINLTDGKITEVFQKEAYNAIISRRDVRGEHVYFECFYLDIPYVGPNLETYGPSQSIPEGLTVENYWEEMPKHRFVDIYDYDIATGELRTILAAQNNKDADTTDDIKNGIVKLAVIERHKDTGHIGLGYMKGYGLKKGAVASSIAHDSHNLIIAGANDEDMALAANTVNANGGGLAVVCDGEVLGTLALPVGGIMCEESAEAVEDRLKMLKKIANALGVSNGIDPFMTLSFSSLPVIPKLKLTTLGLVDCTTQQLVPVLF